MRSKENDVLELFFNSSRQWHFEELLRYIDIGRPQLTRWLKVFQKQGLVKRVKERGKMPYHVQDFHNAKFDVRKKLYAKQKLMASGLLDHLVSLEKANVVIIFGSFSRSDWDAKSDVDIFIYGSDYGFEQGKYEVLLKREIQVHIARNSKDLKKMQKILPYILSGDFVKGSLQDLGVKIHA